MKSQLTDIKGIGPHAAALLEQHGIDSVEILISSGSKKLSLVPGFAKIRSESVIRAAKQLTNNTIEPKNTRLPSETKPVELKKIKKEKKKKKAGKAFQKFEKTALKAARKAKAAAHKAEKAARKAIKGAKNAKRLAAKAEKNTQKTKQSKKTFNNKGLKKKHKV